MKRFTMRLCRSARATLCGMQWHNTCGRVCSVAAPSTSLVACNTQWSGAIQGQLVQPCLVDEAPLSNGCEVRKAEKPRTCEVILGNLRSLFKNVPFFLAASLWRHKRIASIYYIRSHMAPWLCPFYSLLVGRWPNNFLQSLRHSFEPVHLKNRFVFTTLVFKDNARF